jgi:hypothetical protein
VSQAYVVRTKKLPIGNKLGLPDRFEVLGCDGNLNLSTLFEFHIIASFIS